MSADRPDFILVFMADNQGCGYHRCMVPLASMVDVGVADGRIDMAIWPDHVGVAARPDVVVWQRQVEDAQIEAMARWRRALPDALFIYELDDYLEDIPPDSFHASFMPPDIKDRITRALVHVDRVSTTTEPMAVWLRTLTDAEVVVIPNALPVARMKEREARKTGKLRIGFAGGISHGGDLEILRPAMQTIGDEDVTWVFFGMKPDNPPVEIEFHEGMPPVGYLDKLASLDIDLMLAPLQNNTFNRCKSNLRLIEAASIGAAVIAQDMAPYRVDNPPVFDYAITPLDWTHAISNFLHVSRAFRQRSANAMTVWAGRHYILERVLKTRMNGWLPAGDHWQPKAARPNHGERAIICYPDPVDIRTRLPFLAPFRCVTTGLVEACRTAIALGTDLVWLRSATTFSEETWDRLRKATGPSDVGSVIPLASDGPNAFPHADEWHPIPGDSIASLAGITEELFQNRTIPVVAPSGPLAVLSIHALSMLGIPDVEGCENNEEQAILEWGLRASVRNWKHVQVLGTFAASTVRPPQPTQNMILRIQSRGLVEFLQKIKLLALPAVDRELMEAKLLREKFGGPRPGAIGFESNYDDWALLRGLQEPDMTGVHVKASPPVCLRNYECEKDWPDDAWVIFTDDKTTLKSDAIFYFEATLAKAERDWFVIYADHENIIANTKSPEFKPDFDLTLFLGQDYVTPICAVRASMLSFVPRNASDLYAALLPMVIANRRGARHIPRVAGEIVFDAAPESLALETLDRQMNVEARYEGKVTVSAIRQIPGCLNVGFKWRSNFDEPPLVSIIIPTLGSGRLIQPCVATILQHTTYPAYEIIVVQNGTQRTKPELLPATLEDPRVQVFQYDGEFNWSKINNWAIRAKARGDYIVTMNDDICVSSRHWLDSMMGWIGEPEVGCVGPKLIHPMGVIQHAGVVCHKGIAGHMHKGLPNGQNGHLGRAMLSHEAIAVTGACMLFSRESFTDVGGFDESLSHNYNDTVFCVRMYERGKRNIVDMAADLVHPEGSSRSHNVAEATSRLINDGIKLAHMCPNEDPYWNINMNLTAGPGGLTIHGLNGDALVWSDFVVHSDAKRVLLINDLPGRQGRIVDTLRRRDIPIMADLSGFVLSLSAPRPMNIAPWDIRNMASFTRGLDLMGVHKIVLRSLVGSNGAAPPTETLLALKSISETIDVEIDPIDLTTMAPWLVLDGRETARNVFGHVDMNAWKSAYEAITA